MSIRWTEQCVTEVELRAHHVVGGWWRDATLDDLRKACEAVGLVCVVDASGKYATDLDELRTRAEKAEAELAAAKADDGALFSVRDAIDPHRQPGEPRAETVRRLAAERDALRTRAEKADAEIATLTQRAEKVERLHADAEKQIACRNELRAQVASLTAERDALRARAEEAEKAYADKVLELKDEREESADKSMRADAELSNLRAQVAALQPTAERATDEELRKVFTDAVKHARESTGHNGGGMAVPDVHANEAGIRAVAARVRAERCLVTRAVSKNVDILVTIHADGWKIRTSPQTPDAMWKGPNDCKHALKAADVPATLARMLGGGQ